MPRLSIGHEELRDCSVPIYLEHRQNFKLLKSLPPNTVDWSMLCPLTMTPEYSDIVVPTRALHGKLIGGAETPPLWKESWLRHIPLIGRTLSVASNASRYNTTLEQNADFIARDLETRESQWSGTRVGIINGSN